MTQPKYMTKTEMSFGKLIADARQKMKLTQRELAEKLQISFQYQSDLELGRRNPPSDKLLEGFAKHLDLPLELLYYRAGRIPPNLIRNDVTPEDVLAAFQAFAKKIKK